MARGLTWYVTDGSSGRSVWKAGRGEETEGRTHGWVRNPICINQFINLALIVLHNRTNRRRRFDTIPTNSLFGQSFQVD